jgi:hypothetical protein
LEILDIVGGAALDKIGALLADSEGWNAVARNDFCRFVFQLNYNRYNANSTYQLS